MRRWTPVSAVLALLAAGTVAGATTIPSATAAAAPTRHVDVVALGDSYTAGNAAGGYRGAAGCYRSSNTYGARLRQQLDERGVGGSFVNAACSGAVTADVPGQLQDLPRVTKAEAELVLTSMGGNDLAFDKIVATCQLGLLHGKLPVARYGRDQGRQVTAAALFDQCDTLLRAAEGQVRGRTGLDEAVALTRTRLLEIHAAMPQARVVLVGYPYLAADRGAPSTWLRCVPLVNGACTLQRDRTLNPPARLLALIDRARAAQAALVADLGDGYRYADLVVGWGGNHGVGSAEPWINGLSAPLAETYHPASTGHWRTATYLRESLRVDDGLDGPASEVRYAYAERLQKRVVRIGDRDAYWLDALGAVRLFRIPTAGTYRCLVARGDAPVQVLASDARRVGHGRPTPDMTPCLSPDEVRGRLVSAKDSRRSFWVDDDLVRHHVPDTETFFCVAGRATAGPGDLTERDLASLVTGPAVARCADPGRYRGQVVRDPATGAAYTVGEDRQRHSIADPTTWSCLVDHQGWKVNDLAAVHLATIALSPTPATCSLATSHRHKLLRNAGTREVWLVDDGGRRRHVPDGWSVGCWTARGYPLVDGISAALLSTVPAGEGAAACLDPAVVRGKVVKSLEYDGSPGGSFVVAANGRAYPVPTTQTWSCLRFGLGMPEVTGVSRHTLDQGGRDGVLTWPGQARCLDASGGPASNVGAGGETLLRAGDGTPWRLLPDGSVRYVPDWEEGYACVRQSLGGGLHAEKTGVSRPQVDAAPRGPDDTCFSPSIAEGKILRHGDGTAFYARGGTRWWVPDGATFNCLGGWANTWNLVSYGDMNTHFREYGKGARAACVAGRWAQDRLLDCGRTAGSWVVDWWGWRHNVTTVDAYWAWRRHMTALHGADGTRFDCSGIEHVAVGGRWGAP